MKTYRANVYAQDERRVFVEAGGNRTYRLSLRLDLRNHSPTGFSWGYNGSGPAQLALAILSDLFEDEAEVDLSTMRSEGDERAVKWYQQFKDEFISRYTGDAGFVLTEAAIRGWLETKEGGA